MFRIQFIAVAVLLAASISVDGFVTPTTQQRKSQSLPFLSMAQKHQDGQESQQNASNSVAMVGVASFMAAATIFLLPFNTVALALDESIITTEGAAPVTTTVDAPEPTIAEAPEKPIIAAPKYSILKCTVSPKAPACISTSNVRQLDLYAAPWTFSSTADEAAARLKGAIEGEPLNTILPLEDTTGRVVLVESKRSKLQLTRYRMEFLINESDGVITFRSSAPSDSPGKDFGLQRQRLSEIRERAGSFGVMGEELNTADSKSTSERGNGPLGQLKSFYGLQSGAGFEDVLKQ